jgi:HSP20 family molecular chaperone IbpA
MTRMSLFNSPLLLGFDHVERVLDRVAKSANDGYPPYNIEQTGEQSLRITLAVAGFEDEDLNVTVEENQLVIRGRRNEDTSERIFLHRGIATRQFQRAFVLAEGIEVDDAQLDNGLLHIDLSRPVSETLVKTIDIRSKPKGPTQMIDGDVEKEAGDD